MKYLTAAELSKQWNITLPRIGILCADERIEGAVQKGKTWLVPADFKKLSDKRFKRRETKSSNLLPQMTGKEATA